MQLLVLEVGSREPVAAQVAVDLDLRTLVLDVALDALKGLNLLQTSKAFDFESLALIFDVLLEVLQEDALLHLLRGAPVKDFDLTHHLSEQLVLNWPEDALDRHFSGRYFL